MSKRAYLILAFVTVTSVSLSQNCNYNFTGTIKDPNTNELILGATLQIENTKKYATTDIDGKFSFKKLCSSKLMVIISHVAYESKKINVDLSKSSNITIQLISSTEELQEVTIKSKRKKEKGTETISQTRLGKEDIQTIPTGTLGTSLSQVDGLTFASAGTNVQIPIIHGLSGNRILVLNNGLKHGFQNWGNEHAPEIDINSVNNITVIKGAAGVRYGPEALAGVIMVESNPLRLNNSFYGNVGAGFETNGLGGNTNFEIGKGTENWSYFLNGSLTKIGDRNAPDYNLTNSGKEEVAFGLGTRRKFEKWDVKFYYSFIDQNLGLLRAAAFADSPLGLVRAINSPVPTVIEPFSYDIIEPNEENQHHLAKVEVDWKYSDKGKLTFRSGVQLNKRQEFTVRRAEERPIIDLDLLTFDYQLEWNHPTWNGFDGIIGVQYFTQNNDNNPGTFSLPFIPNYNAYRLGVFAIEEIKLGQNTLEAGIRLDFETNDVRGREPNQDIYRDRYTFNNIAASIGYQWELSENSGFKTNIGSAFRTPNVAELFSFGPQGPFLTYGLLRFTDNNGVPSTDEVIPLDNSDVEIEKGYKLINEFKTSNYKNAHAITTYVNYIDNFVFTRPIGVSTTFAGAAAVWIYDQQDVLFLGLDYTWKKEWSSEWSSTYGLSYLWSRNIGKNEPLINQPPISTNLEVKWVQGDFLFFENSSWSIRPSYTFEQFQAPRTIPIETIVDGSADINTESEIFDVKNAPEGFFLLDVSWNFKFGRFDGGISIQNTLNKRYRNYLNELRYFADEIGRNFSFLINYNF